MLIMPPSVIVSQNVAQKVNMRPVFVSTVFLQTANIEVSMLMQMSKFSLSKYGAAHS